MPTYLTVAEMVRNFSEILERVRFRGERFVLTQEGNPMAELGPVTPAAPVRLAELPALLAELPHLGSAEAERFAHDLETLRQAGGATPTIDPWES